ncbi:MAG TPA: hypothetical protein VK737_00395 [Opitutales bacterium]|jgi:hypothetical protein|nr:hypothetical protein [Opitutales bacterium]
MKPLRVFLDANILFSASLGRGVVPTLTEALRLRHQTFTAQLAVEEAKRNLARKSPKALAGLDAALVQVVIVSEFGLPHGLDLPANDGQLLGIAIAQGCTHFLSGDKRHFGAHYGKNIQGVIVLSPTMLFAHPDLL